MSSVESAAAHEPGDARVPQGFARCDFAALCVEAVLLLPDEIP